MARIAEYRMSKSPHVSGVGLCRKCKYRAVCVLPVPVVQPFACPECGAAAMRLSSPIGFPDGEPRRSCLSCKGQRFEVGAKEIICVRCGLPAPLVAGRRFFKGLKDA